MFRPLVVLALAVLLASAAHATETSALYCRHVGTDDKLRPIPEPLAAAAKRLFGLDAPDEAVRRTTVFRCMDGGIQLCNLGANLACGKADARRTLAAASRYCREHPGAPGIPAFVTGHGTIYTWRCNGVRAAAGEPVEALDGRGFVARLWKAVE